MGPTETTEMSLCEPTARKGARINICLGIRPEKFHNSDFDFDLMKIEMKIAVDIASCC